MPHQEVLPARAAQPFQIGDGALRPGNDQDVKAWRDAWIAQVVNGDIRLVFKRFEIRIVRDARQMYHSNSQWLVSRRRRSPIQHRGVLLRQSQVILPRQYSDYPDTGAVLQKVKARFQQLQVAAQFVYQHSLDASALLGREQFDCSDYGSADAALVDICDQ